MKLHIDYNQSMSGIDLLIFWSYSNNNPNEADHEKRIISKPKHVAICAKDQEGRKVSKFKEQFVYISFISERGCQLEVTPELIKAENIKNSIALPTFGDAFRDEVDFKLLEKDDPFYVEYR